MAEDGKIEVDITKRANKSTKICCALNEIILGHKDVDIETKMKIHNTVTIPIIA